MTLWYITTANPKAVLAKGPKADRGFGRKLLNMLNPLWTITPIGQFPLNRSAHVSPGEFYIGGYPRLTVIQTVIDNATTLSTIPRRLLSVVAAADTYAYAIDEETGLGGIAHWRGTTLKRSFVATRNRIYEDYGIPEPFESPFWAMDASSGLDLAFDPIDLVKAAQVGWLGFEVSESGPEINVVGYAIDGRNEPKISPAATTQTQSTKEEEDLDTYDGYDDYENEVMEETSTTQVLINIARKVFSVLLYALSFIKKTIAKLKDKLRYTDRP